MSKAYLIFIVFLLAISIPTSAIDYTPSTDTNCIGNNCLLNIYSGIRYVNENDKWVTVDKAKSLKGKGFDVVYLEQDKDLLIDVKDFNYSYITVSLQITDTQLSKTGNIPLKILTLNSSKALLGQLTKDIKKDYYPTLTTSRTFITNDDVITVTLPFSLDKLLQFGNSSTIIRLNESNNGNIDDAYVTKSTPTTNFGAGPQIAVRNESGIVDYASFIKWNLSVIPTGVTILRANMTLVATYGETAYGVSMYNITNDNWNEETVVWNTKPNRTSYWNDNVTVTSVGNFSFIWNVTNIIMNCYTNATNKNCTTYLEMQPTTSTKWIHFASKEETNLTQRPQLRVEYNGAGGGSNGTSTNITMNGGVGNFTYQYTTTPVNLTAYVNTTGLPINITVNGTQIANGVTSATTTYTFPTGVWNITSYTDGNATYTGSSTTIWGTITQIPTSTNLTINGGLGNITHQYTTVADNLTAYVNVTGRAIWLQVNGVNVSTGTTSTTTQYTFPVGLWNVTSYSVGNTNYSSSITTYWANVTQASNLLTVCLQNRTATYCNPIDFTWETYPNGINVTASSTYAGAVTYQNWFSNGANSFYISNITNNTFYTYNVTNTSGSYWIAWYNVTGNANYSSNSSSHGIEIMIGVPNINITFNTSDTVAQGTPVNVSCNKDTSQITTNLYNDTANNSNPFILNTSGLLGVYNFTCNSSAVMNYTSSTTSKSLTVTAGSGLSINVYDEENTTKGLTFNITVNNGTSSNTAYNQNNPYFNSSITGFLTIDITSSGYQQRTYYITTSAGTATNLDAYLLSASSGSWVLFYVYTATELPIQNALINAERLVPPSSWLTVAQKKTDASGTAAIYLSPITTYRLNFSAVGYTNQSQSVQPSASPYVIYMVSASNINLSYNTSYKNIELWVEPNGTALYQNTTNAFRYYIISTDNQLEFWGWKIMYYNGSQILFQNSTNAGGGTYTTNIDTTDYNTGYIDLIYWFKKADFNFINTSRRYYIYSVHAYNTSIMAQVNDMAAAVAAGTPDVTMEQFAFISMLISIVCMAAASSQLKMFGSGVIGLMILSMFTFIGTYIWGAAYILGWELIGLFGLGVVAAIYIRGGFV